VTGRTSARQCGQHEGVLQAILPQGPDAGTISSHPNGAGRERRAPRGQARARDAAPQHEADDDLADNEGLAALAIAQRHTGPVQPVEDARRDWEPRAAHLGEAASQDGKTPGAERDARAQPARSVAAGAGRGAGLRNVGRAQPQPDAQPDAPQAQGDPDWPSFLDEQAPGWSTEFEAWRSDSEDEDEYPGGTCPCQVQQWVAGRESKRGGETRQGVGVGMMRTVTCSKCSWTLLELIACPECVAPPSLADCISACTAGCSPCGFAAATAW
jgi:hypothetical protein